MTFLKYPKVLSLGQPLIVDIFNDPVEISEKIDGSQVRINLTESHVQCGSKNVNIADEKMFTIAHEQADRIWKDRAWCVFGDDVTLFCEFLNKEKHNVLKYNHICRNNLYLFGGMCNGRHLRTQELIELANELDIEPPNILASEIKIDNQDDLNEYLKIQSVLGGTLLEGIVIKNYHGTYPALLVSTQIFTNYPLVGKLVRTDFKERLNKEWGSKEKEGTNNKSSHNRILY